MELADRRDERGGGRVRLTLLGRIDLSDSSGRRIQSVLSQPKRVALLAYLAIEGRHRLVRRDELTAVFWPRRDDKRGRKALRNALYFLRRSIGEDVILTPGDEVGLDWTRFECDAGGSVEAIDGGGLGERRESGDDDFLPGFHISDAPEFEKWVEKKRASIRGTAGRGESEATETASLADVTRSSSGRGTRSARTSPEWPWLAGIAALVAAGIIADSVGAVSLIVLTTAAVALTAAFALSRRDGSGTLIHLRSSPVLKSVGALSWAGAIGVFQVSEDPDPAMTTVSRFSQLTFSGSVRRAQISPDGRLLAYVDGVDARFLRLKDVEAGTVIDLSPVGDRVFSLRWSPDGARLLFMGADSAGGWTAVEFPRLGGSPRPLRIASLWRATHTIWSPSGSQIASWDNAADSALIREVATGRIVTAFPLPDSVGTSFLPGDWSPDGSRIALAVVSLSPPTMSLWTVGADGVGWRQLVSDTVALMGPRWSPSSDAVYYIRNDELRRIDVGPDGGPVGPIQTLQSGLEVELDEYPAAPSVTSDGGKLVFPRSVRHSNVWLLTQSREALATEGAAVQITQGTATATFAVLASDGNRIAYVRGLGTNYDLYAISRSGGPPRQLTFDGNVSVYIEPAWSPDGEAIAFAVWERGEWRLRTVDLNDGRIRSHDNSSVGGSGLAWAPGRIIYSRPGNRNFNLRDPQTGAEHPLVANDSVGWMFQPVVSPDGRQAAVWWNRNPRGAWVVSMDDSSQVLVHQGVWPLGWTADGKSLYVREEGSSEVLLVPLAGGEPIVVAEIPFEDADCRAYEQPTELLLLCTVQEAVSDAWMIENFDPAAN